MLAQQRILTTSFSQYYRRVASSRDARYLSLLPSSATATLPHISSLTIRSSFLANGASWRRIPGDDVSVTHTSPVDGSDNIVDASSLANRSVASNASAAGTSRTVRRTTPSLSSRRSSRRA